MTEKSHYLVNMLKTLRLAVRAAGPYAGQLQSGVSVSSVMFALMSKRFAQRHAPKAY